MIKNFVILALITINGVFAWSLYRAYQTQSEPGAAVASRPSISTTASPQTVTEPVTPQPESTDITTTSDHALTITPGDDYQSLVDRLRAEGVAEDVLRQIMLATINRDHLLANAAESNPPYWKAAERNPEDKLNKQLAWEADRRQQLLSLFGSDIVDDLMFEEFFKPLNSTLAFLSSDKQIKLYELQRQDDAATQSLFSGGFTQESREDLQTQRQDLQRQIAELLGTDDAFEYQLRESRLADRMRRGLDDFDYSESEFRQIFAIRQENEGVETSRFSSREAYREQRQASEARIRDYLGPDRYEAFARSQDPAYRSLQSIGERYGNSTSEINEIYSLSRSAQEQIDEVRATESLDREERQERIRDIRNESYAQIERIAGKDTAESVKENARRMGFGRRITPGT